MFITFEGIEGCGKTTQVRRLVKRLKRRGIPLVTTLEPGGTGIGKKIRRILLDSRNKDLSPLTELILYAADRAQHVQEVIRPALEEGKWVICDRFFDATVVYQGKARGQDMKLIRILNEKATRGIRPEITYLLDCPVDMGLGRALRRNETQFQKGQDRFEREALAFHNAVREGYLDLARENRDRFVIIDATLPKNKVEGKIFQHIEPFLDI
ncbi:MAG: dTMP kinase [Deltaproteobacteria bacterium]|nr:MAG: dTMP kinase [Deltaproteobacteria bacterium]